MIFDHGVFDFFEGFFAPVLLHPQLDLLLQLD